LTARSDLTSFASGLCPSADEVAAVISGTVSAVERARFWQHAEQCESCRQICSEGISLAAGSKDSVALSTAAKTFAPGDSLGRYIILHELGRGGLGIVFAAYDPTLDRNVAIKILSHAGADASMLLNEARTLAKLSHPNIVAVHDVGIEDGCPYVAMEYVVGQTLRQWMDGAPRTWMDIRDVFLKAADALHFAHSRGVVHLDFKPQNVLLNREGHVQVSDFGLARLLSDTSSTIAGTPAYMAPEQAASGALGPFTDQYAFCVTLAEAISGARPKDATVVPNIKVATTALVAIKRGLSSDPKLRMASMAALARQLRSDNPTKRNVGIALGVATAMTIPAAIWLKQTEPKSQQCETVAALDVTWWTPSLSVDISASLTTNGGFQTEHIVRSLDDYTRAFLQRSSAACKQLHDRSEITSSLFERQRLCLSQGLSSAKSLALLMQHSDHEIAANAAMAVSTLPSLNRCSDAAFLLANIEPATAAQAMAVRELNDLDADATANQLIGKFQAAATIANEFATKAQALGYQPLVARASFLQGDLHYHLADNDNAVKSLQRAATIAARVKDDELSARSWTLLAGVVGYAQGKAAEGHVIAQQADAWLARAGTPRDIDADLAEIHALLFDVDGKLDQAKPFYDKALQVRRALYGDNHLVVAQSLNNLAAIPYQQGLLDEAQALHTRALAIRVAQLGELSPDVAISVNALAQIDSSRGDLDKARRGFERAIAIWNATIGPDHPDTAAAHNELGDVLRRMGKLPEATEHLRKALSVWTEKLGATHPNTLSAISNLAGTYYDAGDDDSALTLFDSLIKQRVATLGATHPSVASALINRSRVLVHLQQWNRAVDDTTAATKIYDATNNPTQSARASAVLAEAELGRKRLPQAKRALELALPVLEKAEGDKNIFANGCFTLAKVQWALHDRSEAVAQAKRALAASSDNESKARIQQWLTSIEK
jgi:eukaryotic-like serine/threonine-protein kinase